MRIKSCEDVRYSRIQNNPVLHQSAINCVSLYFLNSPKTYLARQDRIQDAVN